MAKLIFGCGYLGRRVASRWRQLGQPVYAVTRSQSRAEAFTEQGLIPLVADLAADFSPPALPPLNTVLFAVGFDRSSGHAIRDVYVDGLRRALDALPPETGRIIYISSTGVYGQTDGEVVDEDSACHPLREGGKACLEAEQLLASHPLGRRAICLRLAGIYGPGRIPKLADVRERRPLEVEPDGWLNLIHVDDAAAIVLAAERLAEPPATYVVSDGRPVLRRDFYCEIARLLNVPEPTFAVGAADGPMPRRGSGDKRVDPARMLRDLRPQLQFPSYREGLAAIVAGAS